MPWRGPKAEGERPTLGWLVKDFIETHCVIPDGEFAGQPFELTDWQLEFVLGFYEIHEDAIERQMFKGEWRPDLRQNRAFVYDRGGQCVAPQKLGKSPLAAALIMAEARGPVLFDGWDANGEPVGKPWATPRIHLTGSSQANTKNTWNALIPMITLSGLDYDIPDTGVTRINLPGARSDLRGLKQGGGWIEPVTSSAKSRLGAPITFAIEDETSVWTERNHGHELADTQRRGLAGMGGRFIETTNAWDPAEDSVAQRTWEKETGICKMFVHGGAGDIRNYTERMRVLERLYGASWYADQESISAMIDSLLEKGEVAQAERFYFNRLVPAESRAFDLKRWRELARPSTKINDGATITIGVDGARYYDALAMIATDIATGFQWPLGIWERPENAPDDYEHPLDEVDGTMIDAMKRFNVWRVYIDPGSQYANISALVDKWQGRYGDRTIVAWMMSRPKITALMIRNYASAIITGDVTHDGDSTFTRHIANARRKMENVQGDDGVKLHSIQKEAPRSPLKIDAAAAAALSWEARSDAVAAGMAQPSHYDNKAEKCGQCGHLRRHHVPACRGRPEGHCLAFVEPFV